MRAIQTTIGLVLITIGCIATITTDLDNAAPWLAAGGLAAIGGAGVVAALVQFRDS